MRRVRRQSREGRPRAPPAGPGFDARPAGLGRELRDPFRQGVRSARNRPAHAVGRDASACGRGCLCRGSDAAGGTPARASPGAAVGCCGGEVPRTQRTGCRQAEASTPARVHGGRAFPGAVPGTASCHRGAGAGRGHRHVGERVLGGLPGAAAGWAAGDLHLSGAARRGEDPARRALRRGAAGPRRHQRDVPPLRHGQLRRAPELRAARRRRELLQGGATGDADRIRPREPARGHPLRRDREGARECPDCAPRGTRQRGVGRQESAEDCRFPRLLVHLHDELGAGGLRFPQRQRHPGGQRGFAESRIRGPGIGAAPPGGRQRGHGARAAARAGFPARQRRRGVIWPALHVRPHATHAPDDRPRHRGCPFRNLVTHSGGRCRRSHGVARPSLATAEPGRPAGRRAHLGVGCPAPAGRVRGMPPAAARERGRDIPRAGAVWRRRGGVPR